MDYCLMSATCVRLFFAVADCGAQTHGAETVICDLKTVKPRGVFCFNLHPEWHFGHPPGFGTPRQVFDVSGNGSEMRDFLSYGF
jgi:hypothetical protein